jgi:diguanylate cyclase (GGDEF)-like protein/PAS domain S-box-containing protein
MPAAWCTMNEFPPTGAEAATDAALDSALLALRADPALWQLPFDPAAQRLLDFAVTAGLAEAAELWQLADSGNELRLRCRCYNSDGVALRAVRTRLQRSAVPGYFDELAGCLGFIERIDTAPAAQSLQRPIFLEGLPWGVLTLTRRPQSAWSARDRRVAITLSDLISQLLTHLQATNAEQRFLTLAQNAPVGILQLDEAQNIVYRNNYWVELLGADYTTWTRDVWSNIISPEDDHNMDEDVEIARLRGELRSSYRIRRPDGSERHVLWHVVAEQHAPHLGNAMGRIGIAVDITQLWEAQAQLRELTIRQRAILDNAGHGIIASDAEGNITLFNPAAERMLGYRAEEVLGRHPRMLFAPNEVNRIWQALRDRELRVDITGFMEYTDRLGQRETEWDFMRKDGSIVPVMMSATLLRDAQGKPFGFMGLITDLSDRRRMAAFKQREQALIAHINRGTSATIGAKFFTQLMDELKHAIGADYGNVFELLHNGDGLQGVLLTDLEFDIVEREFDVTGAPIEAVVRHGHRLHLTDMKHQYPDRADVRAMDIDEMIAVPLISSSGGVLGALMVAHRERLGEPELALHLLEIFAVRASSELERLRAERELRAREAAQRWLYAASERIHEQRDVAGVAREAVVAAARHASGPFSVAMSLSKPDGYHLLDYEGPAETAPIPGKIHAPQPELMQRIVQTEHSILLVRDIQQAGVDQGLKDDAARRGLHALALIALVDRGRDIGVITLNYRSAAMLDVLDLDNLAMFGRAVTLALGRALHRQELEYQADHDGLTGLFNRTVLHREFDNWRAGGGRETGLLLLDLDRFKEVNDTLGHHVGDALLRQIGERLREGVGANAATLTRLGGDEFAVLLQETALDAEAAALVADQILRALRRPFAINGVNLEIGASIGVALYPEHGDDSHALLRSADVAMYEAKRCGGGVALYNRNLDFNTPERLALIADFSPGIRERELQLFYQPKIDLHTQQVVGFEGMLRWQHKRLGLLTPDRFLPLLEMSDAIHDLARVVLEIACEQMQTWLAEGWGGTLSINLSARNLIDDRVVRHLSELLQHYRIPPQRLELEITETALIHDPKHALDLLDRIAALGVLLSIDDFGTGYSSLAYLRQMPISTLKIDRTFIRDMLINAHDQLIVRSTIQLAHGLGLLVVAEGVENSDVLARLREMGCDQAQGYYFTRPLPPRQLREWLAGPGASLARGGPVC